MIRTLQLAGLVLLTAFCGSAAQGGGRGKVPAAPRRNPGAGVLPRRAAPKAGPRFTNPANPVARLFRATPDQRDRVLEKLPLPQQERARQLLAWYDHLPKIQQQIVLERQERWDSLPLERRREVQRSIRALQALAPERRQAVNQAFRRLQTLPEEQRSEELNSDTFKSRFSPEEQKIVLDLSEIILPPQ